MRRDRCQIVASRSLGLTLAVAVLPSEQARFALATLKHFKGNPALVFSFGTTALDIFPVAVASSGIV